MKLWASIFMTVLLISSVPSYATLPDLSNYEVLQQDIFTGTPAPVDLSSYKGAKTYRTVLTQGAQKGPNFAGHYTVVSFGCGTQCQDNWIIDAKTGTIYDRFSSVIGQTYRLDSTLMIVNPPEEQLKKAYLKYPDQPLLGTMETTAQVWKENKFEVVKTEKWVDAIKDLP